MSKFIFVASALLFGIMSCISTKNSFWDSPDAYLGQTPPGDTPRIFARQLLGDSGIDMDRVAFSADGREFYYCFARGWFNAAGNKIKYFIYEDHAWKGPLVLNQGFYAPTFSMDDRSLYFMGRGGVWRSQRNASGWSTPELFMKENYGLYDFMPTRSGAIYVGSNGNGGKIEDYSTYDFSRLRITNRDTVIESLGPTLNTPGFDGDFYVSPDESFMILSTNETKDYECELSITFRKDDGGWTTPLSLGPLINDGMAHRWGEYVTPDGKYLFYSKGTSEKDCHIHWVRFDKLYAKLRAVALGK